jgi:hypothetical protein
MSTLFVDQIHAAAAEGRPRVNLACPESHRVVVQRAINRLLEGFWLQPETSDVIPSLEVFKAYIRAFSFYHGFNVVREGGGSVVSPGLRL